MTRIPLDIVDAVGIRADNAGPLTLEGTNTWIVGRQGAWVVDPGPALDAHVAAVAEEVRSRGGLAGVALTHNHGDHSDAIAPLVSELGEAPVVAAAERFRSGVDPAAVTGGATHGPLEVFELPGHSADHLAFIHEGVAFTGDALFLHSSVYVAPGPGSLSRYLQALNDLAGRGPDLIAPAHGPLIESPSDRIAEQVSHRLRREAKLAAALDNGMRGITEVLAVVWDDVPEFMLPAAAISLAAHLDKLEEEGRLPDGVERPDIPDWVM